jgi:hypothetical protein
VPPRRVVSIALAAILIAAPLVRADDGIDAEYVGGTVAVLGSKASGKLRTTDELFFDFRCKGREVSVEYGKINLLEYGQNVSRRVLLAVAISPLFMLSKSKKHFLTVGYTDTEGKQQAMVFKVSKDRIRAVLVSLEARTGLKVQFQDNEARKSGKG